MTLYVSEMYDCDTMEKTLLGVFSKQALAEHAGSNYFDVMELAGITMLDWDYENGIHTYYYNHGYTLTITEVELDKEFE